MQAIQHKGELPCVLPSDLRKITNITEYKRITSKKDEFEHFEIAAKLISDIKKSIIRQDRFDLYCSFPLKDLCNNLSDKQKELIKSAKASIDGVYSVLELHAISIELENDPDICEALNFAIMRLLYGNPFIKKDQATLKFLINLYTQDLKRYSYIAAKKTLNHFSDSEQDLSLPAINEYARGLNDRYLVLFCDVNFIMSF